MAGSAILDGGATRSGCTRRANCRPTIRPISAPIGLPCPTGRCGGFLGVRWAGVRERVLAGGTDEAVLAWAHPHGTPRSDEAGHMGNGLRLKLGWRDERSAVLP